MNTLDLIILLILAGGLFVGLRSGLIKQVLSFVGLIVAFLLGINLMKAVGSLAATSLGISDDIAPLVGFVLVFLIVQIIVFALVRMVEALVGILKLSTVNRVLGGLVGAFKAALVLSVTFLVLGVMEVPAESTRRQSTLYESVADVLPTAWEYVTEAFPQVEHLSEQFGQGVREQLPIPPADSTGDESQKVVAE